MTFLTSGNILLIGSVLLFVSIAVSKTSARFGVPTLLLFLFVGMLFGTDGFGIQFDDMRGAQFVGMIALCIILFSGGMDTKFAEIKPVLGPGLVLSTVGVLLTALFTGIFVLTECVVLCIIKLKSDHVEVLCALTSDPFL